MTTTTTTTTKRPKYGGRVRGTPNRVTSTLREFITDIINDNREHLKADLEVLEPRERIAAIIKLLEYVLPKKKAITLLEDELNDT